MPGVALLVEAAELRARAAVAEAEGRRLQVRERRDAIVAALELYDASLTTRSAALEIDLKRYLGVAWLRERDLESLPETSSPLRRALHRIAQSRNGEGIKARRIFDVAKKCNQERLRLHKFRDEASPENGIGEAQ
ncbi:hypothetical protein [Methylocystis sp.]|uniref:hypothetical protein n=1 Tax=Methylocystis sp. TaxID=1911079 RepID=UPI0025DF51DF|nr:hypothetical protein [Methylocystis sp.]